MKRFYVFWFFFCAGWGYLMAQPLPEGFAPRSISMALASLPVAAVTSFVLIALELWRYPNHKLPRPSIYLKPWQMPLGCMIFISISFMFNGVWAVIFAFVQGGGQLPEAVHFLLLGAGSFIGVWGVFRVFPARFAA